MQGPGPRPGRQDQGGPPRQSRFQDAFEDFFALCRTALNPNISQAAVDEMLVQHLLTERLIRKIFDNPEFTQRNVIAVQRDSPFSARNPITRVNLLAVFGRRYHHHANRG